MELDYSYISAELISDQVPDIMSHLLAAGIAPATKYDFHVTLIYDERELTEPLCELDPKKQFKANITKLEVLGDGLVFHLTSRDMMDEFKRLTDAGYEHSFDTLLPHMSIAYDFSDYDILMCQQVFAEWGGRELTFHNTAFGFKKSKG